MMPNNPLPNTKAQTAKQKPLLPFPEEVFPFSRGSSTSYHHQGIICDDECPQGGCEFAGRHCNTFQSAIFTAAQVSS
jgi:hypothetical protein